MSIEILASKLPDVIDLLIGRYSDQIRPISDQNSFSRRPYVVVYYFLDVSLSVTSHVT